MSKTFFKIYQIKDDYLYMVKKYWNKVYDNKTKFDVLTGAPISRPYFGPILYDDLKIYIPLSSKSCTSKNGIKKLKTINNNIEMFTYNKNMEPRGYINFTRMLICPKNESFAEKRNAHVSDADRIFINEKENVNKIISKAKDVYNMLFQTDEKFQKLACWCKHPETQFPSENQDFSYFYILFVIFVFVIAGIVCGVVFGIK